MDGQTLKIAAAGCFAMIILSTAVASRFDIAGSFANVFTTLTGSESEVSPEVVVVPGSDEWRSSLSKYTTINPDVAGGATATASSYPELSMTDTFARAMFEMYLRNRSEIDTSGSRVRLAEDFAETFRRSIEPKVYTTQDVTISPTALLATYIPSVSTAMAQTREASEHEIAIFKRLMSASKTPSDDIAALIKISEVYTRIEKEMLIVPVPNDLVGSHLDMINAIASIRAHIIDMATFESDPLRAVAGMQAYIIAVDNMRAAVAILQLKANMSRLTFPENTPGWMFMKL